MAHSNRYGYTVQGSKEPAEFRNGKHQAHAESPHNANTELVP